MASTLNVYKPLKVIGPAVANVDALYGPYNSVADACTAIPISRRVKGRTVGILDSEGVVSEYWWKSGLEDADLISKDRTQPTLSYTEDFPEGTIIRKNLGDNVFFKVSFTSPNYGNCVISVYKNGSLVKNVTSPKGIINIDLGDATSEGTAIYSVTGVDSTSEPAPQELTFTVVVGGASISSDFQNTIDSGINTSSDLSVIYNASVADTSKTIKVLAQVINSSEEIIATHTNIGSGSTPYVLTNQTWNIGVLEEEDSYVLKMSAYTGENPEDESGDNVTKTIVYNFTLMDVNNFAMSSEVSSVSTDTNTAITIPFRIYCGSNMVLRAHGSVQNSQGQEVSGVTLDRQVSSNTLNYWSLGKLSTADTYTIIMYATTVDGSDSPSGRTTVYIEADVAQYVPSYSIVTDGLIAQFTSDGKSNNNDRDTAGYWINDVQGSDIYFQLKDLNYNTNGWIPTGDYANEIMLKFSGDSYGRLKQRAGLVPLETDNDYFPMSNLSSSATTGFTAEVIFRSRCIGELKSKVITGHQGNGINTCGFGASYNKVSVGSNDAQVVLDVAEDEWIHATMVIDKTTRLNPSDVQDYAPEKLMTLYINGSACAAAIITDTMTFTNYGPVLLNSAINPTSAAVDYFGECEIKAIRFYNKPLLASEVVQNYIASVYDATEQARIAGRNGDVLPIVRFINKNTEYPATAKEISKGVQLVSFAELNQMTEKSQQKKKYVHGDVIYTDTDGSETTWTHCIIQTQGTSTLAFPVKNYKIKLYQSNFSTKVYTDAFADKGWRADYVYTLKCDYMEAAHLNNTPSCEFYNNMIDEMVADGTIADGWNNDKTVYTQTSDERTPSRRGPTATDDISYFDAIKGFPCLVYYYESETDYIQGNGVYVGTYMFNLDKAAESLGFDMPAKLSTDGETVIQVENPRYTEGGENPQYLDSICQSFEGVANGSDTAGCFYSYADWQDSFYNTYCTAAYTIWENEGGTGMTLDEFVQYYSIDHPDVRYRTGSDIPVDYDDHGYLNTEEDYIAAQSPYEDEYDYFASDYEMRYDWDELEEGGEEFWGNSSWGLKRMIDWVSSASATSGSTTNDVFKSEFNNYFNLKYVILYYLQMIVFGQVDNAGKNSMWDTWDGLIWYPRPYDLDTMAGLDNTGFEVITPDAELIQDLSPFQKYNNTTGTANYSDDVSATANIRYRAYNTRTSKFWIAFATSFKTDIQQMYATLRTDGIYSVDNIMKKFKAKTTDIIGEAYYNRDMTTKFYKLADINTFISRMHGNRVQKFQAWITSRLIFCDTYFNYQNPTTSLNNNIILRSDAVETSGTISVNVGVTTYSPQYVRVDVGSGYDAILEAYCSPDSRYIDPITGDEMEGLLFTIPIPAGDKEIQFTGGGNIKEIINLNALKPKSLTLNNAVKLTSLDVSYSTKLLALSLSNNTYLQTLDCRGAVQLGTDASGAQLDLSNCVNLKEAYFDNTKLTSIVFPIGGALQTISAKNTAITAITLNSLHFLTNVDVSGCENILSYTITNCPKITSIVADNLPLTTVSITNCTGLASISLQSDTAITSYTLNTCPNVSILNFSANRSSAIETLDLTTLYGLTQLDISGAVTSRIKFPKYTSATSSTLWGNNFTTISMSGSDIAYIQYGETTTTGIDMSQLTGLTFLTFKSCTQIEHIVNLNYTGSCNELFRDCFKLLEVKGTLTCTSSAVSMFQHCLLLNNLSELTFNFTNCTSLQYAFRECPWITYDDIKNVLDCCGTSLTNITGLCYDKDYGVASQGSAYTVLPDYFFGNCKFVTTANSAFYASGLTSIPENAFIDEDNNIGLASCTNLRICFCSTKITSIPTNIIKYLPAATDISGLFQSCSSLEITLPSNFFNPDDEVSFTSTITTTKGLFYSCPSVSINMTNMVSLLAPLTALTDASIMFAGCTGCVGVVPEGFFAKNTALTTIAGCFMNTKITGIPPSGSLFRASGDESTTFTRLISISGLFSGCTGVTTTLTSELLKGATRITDAGTTTINVPTGGQLTLNGAFYGCTGLTTFSKSLLATQTELRNISSLFQGCTGLMKQTESDTFDGTFLSNHTKLTNVSNLFKGCSVLNITVVPQLFTNSKNTITSVSGLFYGCTFISGIDENLLTNMVNLTNASYAFYGSGLDTIITSFLPFAGCTKLQNVSYCFGSTNISGDVPAGLFNSCRSTLNNTSHMFDGCLNLNGTIRTGDENLATITQYGLLANCLSLTDTSYMFNNCQNLRGAIPWDIFWTSSSEYLYSQLKNTSYMFHNCKFDTPVTYQEVNYLFHPEMFTKLIALTTTTAMFKTDWNYTNGWGANSYSIYPTSFDGQYFLSNIDEMFSRCTGLGGVIANGWFNHSIATLTSAIGAFAYTRITDVGTTFLRANSSSANTKLANVSKMFYGCGSLTGALPLCNNTSVFSRINYASPDVGYKSYAYRCTSASNYNDFYGTSGTLWTEYQSY